MGIFLVFSQDIPKMVSVPGGTFLMGDSLSVDRHNTQKAHLVTLDAFAIGETPVTVAQWKFYCEQTNREMPAPPAWGWQDDHPMVNVTWAEAVRYTDWLSFHTGRICRLPTEAEWEYAAKEAGKLEPHRHSGNADLPELGWFLDNCPDGGTKPVARKKPNALGLFDMSGNVWEWCRDWHHWYPAQAVENPNGPPSGMFKVVRGGSWYNTDRFCRVGHRGKQRSANRLDYIGFRVVAK